jgi:O-antigen ligase
MAANNIKDIKQARFFVYAFILTAFLISGYAWFQHFTGAQRVSAPFEGKEGEPNTLGGYLLLIIAVAGSLFLHSANKKIKIFTGIFLIAAFIAVLFTLSRGSWVSFVPAYAAFIFLARRGKLVLLVLAGVFLVTAPFILPKQVKERIDYTFQRQTQRNFMGKSFYLDESSAARIDTWTQGISAWSKSPFIGRGAGGAGPSADNQYIRILLETGILGFLGFIFLIFSLYINSLRVLQICQQDNFCYSVVSGFISGLSGLLVHAASAGTFIIIRIMEPFWFLAAIVLTLPALSQENTGDEFKKRDD